MSKSPKNIESDEDAARINMARYDYAMKSGHRAYIERARYNEDMYLGGGLQWREQDRLAMGDRPMVELNHILPAVNTATGLQLHSRVDMQFLPAGGQADQQSATVMSKVVGQICNQIDYHWAESQAYEDGLIQQRGYLDFRMDFAGNMKGSIELEILDPMDVKPDPDARSYDPKYWNDVIIDRWMTYDDLAERYSAELADQVEQQADAYYGMDDSFLGRPHFNEDSDGTGFDGWVTQDGDDRSTRLYLVIDRQHRRVSRGKVFVAWTGEVTPLDLMDEADIARSLDGGIETIMNYRRIMWTVTCGAVVLHNDWSPYKTYTTVPYFPYFRRGRTRGMVDNLTSPQELENKSITNYLEILGSTSNSGWDVPEGVMINMEPEDLEKNGSKNGLVIVSKVNPAGLKPTRRAPNPMPLGTDKLIDRAEFAIKTISGMSDALQGQHGNEVSGKAIQSKQYMGQTQMGRPLDNLAFTRRLAAKKIVELVQQFYTEEQVIRIMDMDTNKVKEELVINQVTVDGILNDVTIGTYDVVISETPTHATFENGQFDQLMAMRESGVQIPDAHVIGASSYAKKHELLEEIEAASAAQTEDPMTQAETDEKVASAELKRAQARKAMADAVNTSVESKYSAVQTAGVIAAQPTTAPLADVLLRSSGDIDMDKPPLLPEYPMDGQEVFREEGQRPTEFPAGAAADFPTNTNPLTPVPPPDPPSPLVGVQQGIETKVID